MAKRALLIVCIIFLLLSYTAVYFLDIGIDPGIMSFFSTIIVIIAALSYAFATGIPLGIAVGAANFYFSGISPADIEAIYSVQGAGVIFPVICGFFFGYFGHINKQKHRDFLRIMKERDARENDYQKKIKEYKSITDRMTTDTVYRKGKASLPFSDPGIERTLGAFLEHFPAEEARRSEAGQVLADKCFGILSDAVPEAFAIMDLSGRIAAYSPPLLAMYGYFTRSSVLGMNISDLVAEEHRDDIAANIGRVLLTGINRNKLYKISPNSGWVPDGPGPGQIRLVAAGNPVSVIAMLTNGKDTDERFPSFEELRGKNIWIVSGSGNTLYINERMASMLGYSRSEMTRYRIFHFLDEQNTAIYRMIAETARGQKGVRQNIELVPKDGRRVYAFMQVFPAYSEGSVSGLIIFTEDITERKLVEISLKHRLAIEKLITDVSTRFINVEPEKLSKEIEDSMELIGDFLGARESHVRLFASLKTGREFSYSIIRDSMPAVLKAEEETTSIPVMSGQENAGYFRFVQSSSSRSWLEEDINLLKMAGEIFMNAMIRKHTLEQLEISEEKMRITLHSIGDAVIATDTDGRVIMINKEAQKLTGWDGSEALGKQLRDVFRLIKGKMTVIEESPEAVEEEKEEEPSMLIFDSRTPVMRSKQGVERVISANAAAIKDDAGNRFGAIYVFRDITDKKKREEEIIYLSFHDKLTGLHNRAFFEVELKRLDTKRQYPLTIIIGDCNGLKITNDIFGHFEGDRLLIKIASIFRSVTRKEDIVARWGGDEFAIILPRTPERTAAEIRTRILNECMTSERAPIQPSISLGSATKTDSSEDIAEIIKEAEDRMYRHKLLEDKSNRSSIIASLEQTLIEKSHETEAHAKRMQDFSERIALAIGLSDNEIDDLRLLSVLHDMGKIGIPDVILEKPAKLTEEEWEIMKTHPEKGFAIAESSNEMSNIAKYILHHHEHWDGSGYPHGLSGGDIPKLSRIISIVDAYDVITHARPYKKALTHEEAIAEIKRCSGSQFDPELVDVFVDIMAEYMKEQKAGPV